MKHRLLIVLSFIGIALGAYADEVVFKAQAPKQVVVGRPFQLTFSVNQRSRDLRAPEFTDFDVLSGPYTSTSSSTSFVNGHRTSSFEQTYTYMLMAQKAGSFTIAPASIKVDGETYQSNGVRITVLPEDEQPSNSSQGGQAGAAGQAASRANSNSGQGSNVSSENIFVRTGDDHNFSVREELGCFFDKRGGEYAVANKRGLEDTDFIDLFPVHVGVFVGPVAQFGFLVFNVNVPGFEGF